MSYFIIEMDSDHVNSKEAEDLLKQITPVKSFREITETQYTNIIGGK